MKDIINNSIIITIVLIGIAGVTLWSAAHDKKIEEVAEQYEECVRTEMHTTPTAYYDQYGEFPECK